jgi:hypothetical protein
MSFLALSRHVMCMQVTIADWNYSILIFLHIFGRLQTFPVVKMMPHSGVD